ncbi:MAG: hypothetical protein FJ276_19820 [Planctomycetes bacterium]|nr:hypothetical protein [Planctomycetota bacterium]
MPTTSSCGKIWGRIAGASRKVLLWVSLVLAAMMARPASAQYQVFWGDVHGHTSHSDGKGSLDDYFTYARDVSNLDFAIVTDHDFGNGNPTWHMPKDTWALTQDKADEYTVDGKFIAIAGYEWTSQAKYWTDVGPNEPSERLFPGPPNFYNHKNVYFPARVDYILSAKDPAYFTPDLLAEAVRKRGGLIHNNHPDAGPEGRDQWSYSPNAHPVIANTEIRPDTLQYEGKTYQLDCERVVREFLGWGGKTGFVLGTDTHEGQPAARTAVLAGRLTRQAIFDALRNRRNYAVTNARIVLDFQINGHCMGEEIVTADKPEIAVSVTGTAPIAELAIIRDGSVLHCLTPQTPQVKFTCRDDSFQQSSYYYLRVIQDDSDEHGNRSYAWSSPIWVKQQRSSATAAQAPLVEIPLVTVPDPSAPLPAETTEQQAVRHGKVARARAGTIVIVHRGAWQFAPENTLSAIRAAFELGANGVELDFRRTKDGVLVLLHDDRLERLLDGLGSVEQSYYEELLLYTFRSLPAPAAQTERVPSLRDVLQLVRGRAGLMHLDIKEPGIDDELLEELRQADMVDHVVTFNDYNSEAFRRAAVAKLPFKGSLMDEGRDTDLHAVQAMLRRPGNMVILDDPRATLTALGSPAVRVSSKTFVPLSPRPTPSCTALEGVLRGDSRELPLRLAAVRLAIFAPRRFCELAGELHEHPSAETRLAVAWNLGMIAKHRPELASDSVRSALVRLLADREIDVRSEAAVACGRARIDAAVPMVVKLLADRPDDLDRWTEDESRQQEKRTIIEARARYAFALGLLGAKSPAVTDVLVDAVKHRALHRDLMLVGLDGAMAAWALGRLRAADSVGALREALFRDDLALEKVRSASGYFGDPASPARWWDFNMHESVLPALAEIGSDEARHVLETALDPTKGVVHPYRRTSGAEALLNARLGDRIPMCAKLLEHGAPEVRRCAVLTCLQQSDPQYRRLLESATPWALPWWDTQHGEGNQ